MIIYTQTYLRIRLINLSWGGSNRPKYYISNCSSCSTVGRDSSSPSQKLVIDDEVTTAQDTGVICHELFHALGREHEHSRADRNKYVNIIWKNIKPGKFTHTLCVM